jgi:hypothetical protein
LKLQVLGLLQPEQQALKLAVIMRAQT